MSKHTKTPWGAAFELPPCSADGWWRIHGNCTEIASIEESPKAEANAAFIIRSVNNHEALIKALEDLADCGNQEHDDEHDRTCSIEEPGDCAICAARAAIAAAKGES